MTFPWREWLVAELQAKDIGYSETETTSELWARWREATEPERRFQEAVQGLERFSQERL